MAGTAWSVCGPNTQYMHRRRNMRQNNMWGSFGGGGYTNTARWEPGTVIGVMLDLERREMRFSFDGKEDETGGVPFSAFDYGDGLYPAITLNVNSRVDLNLGRRPFGTFSLAFLRSLRSLSPFPAVCFAVLNAKCSARAGSETALRADGAHRRSDQLLD